MNELGYAIKAIRESSPYREIRSFARQVGLSGEGMRKIEVGERIPGVDTIEKIIAAVDMNKEEARRLRAMRDFAHAAREGLVDKGISDKKVEKLTDCAHEAVIDFLAEFDMGLEEEDGEDLRNRLRAAMEKEIRG